jgi:hypothetical protein
MPIKMKFELGSPDIVSHLLYKQMYGEYDGKLVDVYGFYHHSSYNEQDYAYVRFPGSDCLESVELTYLSFTD